MCVCVCVCVLQPWVLYRTPKWHRKKGRHKFLPPTHGRMLKESELEYKSHPELFCSSPYSWWSNSSMWTSVNYGIHGLFWRWEDKRPCQWAEEMFSKGGMEGICEGVKKGFVKDSLLWRKRKGGNGERLVKDLSCSYTKWLSSRDLLHSRVYLVNNNVLYT